jgi:DNA-binding GntR family transcriptional regulator
MSAEQIAADLTDRIRRGEYAPGTQLPTYDSLAALYNVSTGTIARVMIVLRTRGTVIGVPGRGTFVPDLTESQK